MTHHPRTANRHRRRGIALIAVLVVVAALALAAYRFSEVMAAEYQAADSYHRQIQARALADSGVHLAAALLANPEALAGLNGNLYDNPTMFRAVPVQDAENPRFRGRCSLLSPIDPDSIGTGAPAYRYGVTDECGKLNINALMKLDSSGRIAHDALLKLPNMTEDIVNAILDWLDPDEQPRAGGAENDYYPTLVPAYRCKNGPLDSLEELLFVKGVTPQLLFGNDFNRNGLLDPDEDDGTGFFDPGWSAYLTVYSRELNVDSTGQPRIYVNDSDLAALYEKLYAVVGEDVATFIVAYRMYGQSSQGSSGGSQQSAAPSRGGQGQRLTRGSLGDLGQQGGQRGGQGRRSIASLFELINAQVSIPSSQPGGQPTVYPSPLSDTSSIKQYLPLLLDKVTTVRDPEMPARVNVNTAPRAVLLALPNLDEAQVETILGARPPLSAGEVADEVYQTPCWLITEAGFPAQTLRSLERYITARSQVYRVQSVGHFDGGGPTARVEAVIDTNAGRPRIVYYRDLTELGRGFNLGPSP